MILAIIVIAKRGYASQGQEGFLSGIINRYIEETTAAVITYPSQYQLAEANSVSASGTPTRAAAPTTLENIQNNVIISHSTALADVVDNNNISDHGNQVVTYVVQEGDSLKQIAYDFGVSVQSIMWANNLKNADQIRSGTELKIPPVSGVIHRVRAGDTIASIAKRYSADPNKILSFNNISGSSDLHAGDDLIIPDGKMPTIIPSGVKGYKANESNVIRRFASLPVLGGYYAPPATGYDWGILHGRNGVDIANSCGTPIYAAAEGTIKLAKTGGYNGGYGNYVVITHPNGTETLYAHAMRLLATVGESVTRGEQIAIMGTTGHSTGCHVHFEVHGAHNPMAKD